MIQAYKKSLNNKKMRPNLVLGQWVQFWVLWIFRAYYTLFYLISFIHYPVSWDFVDSYISGPKNPISALKLNPVPKNHCIQYCVT